MNAFAFDRFRKTSARASGRIVPLPVEPLPRMGRGSSKLAAALPPLRPLIADLCYFGLRLSGWMALTLLATFGLYALFFMALGAFTAEGFFAHLENLATRYGQAEAVRQAHFLRQLGAVTLILFIAVSMARYRSLAAVFSTAPDPRKD